MRCVCGVLRVFAFARVVVKCVCACCLQHIKCCRMVCFFVCDVLCVWLRLCVDVLCDGVWVLVCVCVLLFSLCVVC